MAAVIAEVRSSGLFRARRMSIFQMTAGQPDSGASLTKANHDATILADAPMFRAGAMRSRPTLKCLWFNGAYLKDRFRPGQLVALYGKVEQDTRGRGLQIIQPQFEILGDPEDEGGARVAESLEIGRIVPIYETPGQGKLPSRWFRLLLPRGH